jgi:hypothetical protein
MEPPMTPTESLYAKAALIDYGPRCARLNLEGKPVWRKDAPFVDVSVIHEYGLDQRLSNAIRCF